MLTQQQKLKCVQPPMYKWSDIDKDWFQYIRRCGFPFQRDYVVFDLETTGLEPLTNYIMQVGILEVVDNEIKRSTSVILDWTRILQGHQLHHLKLCLDDNRKFVRTYDPGPYKFRLERISEVGVNPREALNIIADMCDAYLARGSYFVTFNGRRFDTKFLRLTTSDVIGRPIDIYDDVHIDVGLMEKASQVKVEYPYKLFTLKDFYIKAVTTKPNEAFSQKQSDVKWKLPIVCEEKYHMGERYNIDFRNAHDAEFDCLITHYLYQEHYRMAHGDVV